MAGLADIRAQHPEYNDLSDQALADGMYKKYYSDMPRAVFDQKMGLSVSPTERFKEADPQTTAERPAVLGAALDDKTAEQAIDPVLRQRRDELNDIGMTVGSEVARMPAYALGAAGDLINVVAKPIGTAIGDIARRATGKEGLASPDQAADPAHLSAIPGSKDIRTAASNLTGVELHDPTTTPGKVAGVVTDVLAAGGRGLLRGEPRAVLRGEPPPRVPKAPAVAEASTPKNPLIKETIKAAKEAAGGSGRQLGPVLREQMRAALDNPEFMKHFSPEEQATLRDIAAGKLTEKGAALVARLADNPILNYFTAGHAGLAKTAARGMEKYATAKNIRILNAIVGGAGG